MAIKHYMSIFLDEKLHQAVADAATSDECTKSRIGREALEFYLGISPSTKAQLYKLAGAKKVTLSTALNQVVKEQMTTNALRNEGGESV